MDDCTLLASSKGPCFRQQKRKLCITASWVMSPCAPCPLWHFSLTIPLDLQCGVASYLQLAMMGHNSDFLSPVFSAWHDFSFPNKCLLNLVYKIQMLLWLGLPDFGQFDQLLWFYSSCLYIETESQSLPCLILFVKHSLVLLWPSLFFPILSYSTSHQMLTFL
jgi:hypothetical protein